MSYKENPDKEYVREMRHAIKENGGYCPCRIEKNADTRCMCKDFREQILRDEKGYCNCGLWYVE